MSSSESDKTLRNWWWMALFAIVIVGITMSNESIILVGFVLMVVAAILNYILRAKGSPKET